MAVLSWQGDLLGCEVVCLVLLTSEKLACQFWFFFDYFLDTPFLSHGSKIRP